MRLVAPITLVVVVVMLALPLPRNMRGCLFGPLLAQLLLPFFVAVIVDVLL